MEPEAAAVAAAMVAAAAEVRGMGAAAMLLVATEVTLEELHLPLWFLAVAVAFLLPLGLAVPGGILQRQMRLSMGPAAMVAPARLEAMSAPQAEQVEIQTIIWKMGVQEGEKELRVPKIQQAAEAVGAVALFWVRPCVVVEAMGETVHSILRNPENLAAVAVLPAAEAVGAKAAFLTIKRQR